MDKKIRNLSFEFENLETVTVPSEHVLALSVTGITAQSYVHNGHEYGCDKLANEVLVMFKREADEGCVSSFDEMCDKSAPYFYKTTLFNRLSIYSDVVGITVEYEDGSTLEVGVPWDEERNQQNNRYQETFIQKNENYHGVGCFCLHIGKMNSYEDMKHPAMDNVDTETQSALMNLYLFLQEKLGTLYKFDLENNILSVHTPFLQHNRDAISVYISDAGEKGFCICDGNEVFREYQLVGKEEDLRRIANGYVDAYEIRHSPIVEDTDGEVRLVAYRKEGEEFYILSVLLEMVQMQVYLFGRLKELLHEAQ